MFVHQFTGGVSAANSALRMSERGSRLPGGVLDLLSEFNSTVWAFEEVPLAPFCQVLVEGKVSTSSLGHRGLFFQQVFRESKRCSRCFMSTDRLGEESHLFRAAGKVRRRASKIETALVCIAWYTKRTPPSAFGRCLLAARIRGWRRLHGQGIGRAVISADTLALHQNARSELLSFAFKQIWQSDQKYRCWFPEG